MSEIWNEFLNNATVVVLKETLRKLKISTVGNKSELKKRLQDNVVGFLDDQLLELIPVSANENDGGNNSNNGNDNSNNGINNNGNDNDSNGENDHENDNRSDDENDEMFYPAILGRNYFSLNNLVLKVKDKEYEKETEMKIELIKNQMIKEIHENINTEIENQRSEHEVGTTLTGTFENFENFCNEDFVREIMNIDVTSENDVNLKTNENLPVSVVNEVKEIVRPVLFSNSDMYNHQINLDDDFKMEIKLTKEEPFYCAPRRLPYAHKVELQKILDKGIIRESKSPYVSPIVLVKKKNGEFRLCIDYRDLNKVTERVNFPLPIVDDQLDRLKKKKYFTRLDLKNGFHHVKIDEDSIKYTAFITPLGHYEYLRMPFGLKNAPPIFEKFMKRKFGKLIASGKILTFIDDILIATETIEENVDILKQVMNVIKENCLLVRLDKCSFLDEEIVYLGYKISINGIQPNDDNLKAIKNFKVPTCTKDVHSFLGLCSYFRKFIQNFAVIAKPLYDLLRKDSPFSFGSLEFETFEVLKRKLIESPVLSIFSPHNETELHCDASSVGFGGVLLQKQDDKKFHPVFYFSKRVTEAESRYHSFELETLAIIYALRRFRVYLLGIEFKIITDCQSLTLTLNKKLLNPRISRWALELQDYNYKLEHRSGDRMPHADALSRAINILHVTDESFEFILAASQRQDPKIEKIACELEKCESSIYDMIDGLIYRKVKDRILFYVPENMVTQVIRTHHETMCHLGVEKCFEYLSRSYWFPEMKKKIRDYIKTCLKCISFSPNSGKKEGTLHSIPKGQVPFDIIHIDHFGPLANSRLKKKHIFLIIDGFTKFVKLYAVKSTTSEETISCLKSYFENYSRPNKIVSDRGTSFTSQEFADFMTDNNVQHIKIASHCPQANGQVERINRILTPMLAKQCDPTTTSDWDRHLAKIEFSLNNTVSRSTGFSPSMLLFGRHQKGQVCDRILELLENNSKDSQRIDLEDIRKQASQNISKVQEYNKVYYDQHHKQPTTYQKGDYVMIRNFVSTPGVNKKLFAKFRGPYEVNKVLPNDRYLIKDIEGMQLTRVPYKGVCAPQNMRPFAINFDSPK